MATPDAGQPADRVASGGGRPRVTIGRGAISVGDRFTVTFQRTLRIPDDGRVYPLPPGLGVFPVVAAADCGGTAAALSNPITAVIPMYQREALWLGFDAAPWKPNAVKVAVGGINVLTGDPDAPELHADPQDYVVCPPQLWLDGVNVGHGVIRQFVAMRLGTGHTIEAALTGAERVGGLQITVYEPKPGRFPDEPPARDPSPDARGRPSFARTAPPMGLGAGGTMKQKIYPDPYGVDTWDQATDGRITVQIVNSEQFRWLTGHEPPPTPVSAKKYTEHGLPWFDLYDEAEGHVATPERLRDLKTVTERDRERGEPTPDDESLTVKDSQIKTLDPRPAGSSSDPPRRGSSGNPEQPKPS